MKKNLISAVLISVTLLACKTSEKTTKTASSSPAPSGVESVASPLPEGAESVAATVTFSKDIKPIMDTYCTSCHNYTETGGYNFLELAAVKRAASNGNLLGTITHGSAFAIMPPSGEKLDKQLIAKIETWIKSGMN